MITLPLALVFAVLALQKHWGGVKTIVPDTSSPNLNKTVEAYVKWQPLPFQQQAPKGAVGVSYKNLNAIPALLSVLIALLGLAFAASAVISLMRTAEDRMVKQQGLALLAIGMPALIVAIVTQFLVPSAWLKAKSPERKAVKGMTGVDAMMVVIVALILFVVAGIMLMY
jgi:hypothetical protein